jgi:hypothetical protein
MKKEMMPFIEFKEKLWRAQEKQQHRYMIARNW